MRRAGLGAAAVCLVTASAAVLTPGVSTAGVVAADPNVILISVDDLGWGQPSLNGGQLATPNLDRITQQGARFTDGYVAAPVCSPSRAALMSGVPGARFGADSNQLSRTRPERLPAPAIAGLLRGQGYSTMAVGKWDLSGVGREDTQATVQDNPKLPHQVGFDRFYGILGGIADYCTGLDNETYNWDGSQYRKVTPSQYLTDEFSTRAAGFVRTEAPKNAPFFLYLSYNAPHNPMQSRQSCAGQQVTEQERFRQMVTAMDEGVGQVLDALGDDAANTMVVFTSDNGPERLYWTGDLRGKKYTLFEGGIRIPFAISWPARLGSRPAYSEMVSTLDLLPTVAAAAGAPVTGYEGRDLMPYLTGEQAGAPHARLHWRYVDDLGESQGTVKLAIRSGKYKWIRETAPGGATTEHLFDLAADRTEQHNLAGDPAYDAVRNRLIGEYQQWNEQNRQNDSFENVRPDGRQDGYLGYEGTWSAPSTAGDDAYRGVSDGLAGRVMLPATYYADVDAEVDVRLATEGHAGLIIRGRSGPAAPYPLTGYVVRLASAGKIIVTEVRGGTATVVKEHARPIATDVDYRLGVRMTGATMTVTVNGVQQFQWTDPDPIAGGSIGLRVVSGTALFDHLIAERAAQG